MFYWKNAERRRDFLGQFARNNDFDPLIPDNWYSVPLENVLQDKVRFLPSFFHPFILPYFRPSALLSPLSLLTFDLQGIRSMLNQSYSGKLGSALAHLFPEIGFNGLKFKQMHGMGRRREGERGGGDIVREGGKRGLHELKQFNAVRNSQR